MPEGEKRVFDGVTLEEAATGKKIIHGKAIMCDREMNLYVDTPFGKGVIPREEIAYTEDGVSPKDIAVITRVGKPICFTVKEYGTGLVLSRREAQKMCYEEYIEGLKPGDIIPAEVTHLEPFGAFLDIGCGYPALMSVDSISVSRISHPKDRLSVGDKIYAVVRSVDRETRRVFVSQRELFGTWEENAEMFTPGETVRGIIRSVEEYGIFVELSPNLAGLAEIRKDFRKEELVGRFASVYIKSIIPERMKIKLVLIEVLDECKTPVKAEYFISPEETEHIDIWEYSPANAPKRVVSEF